jgi:multimeric flavodoxin WrbA
MKVLAFNGSPRKEGNTFKALKTVLDEIAKDGVETETVHIGGQPFRGCVACGVCMERGDCRCVQNDGANRFIEMMIEADGILLGSPVYYAGINGAMKAFLDRAFFAAAGGGFRMRLKVGAAVVAVRRSGGTAAFDQLNKYLMISEMIIPSSNYWNIIHGMEPGEAAADAEGLQAMRVLGRNMSWLLRSLALAKASVPPPEKEPKTRTNFIR